MMEDNPISTPAEKAPDEHQAAPDEQQAAPDEHLAVSEGQPQAEMNPVLEEETPLEKPARSNKWLIISGILILFLAAAAFLGARLLKPQLAAGAGGGGGMFLSSKGGPGGGKSVRLNMTPAKELPQDKPSTSGIFVRREDQSIFIGTGNVQIAVRKSAGGSANAANDVSSHYDGPVVEVVVNHQTKIYQDITEMMPPDQKTNGGTVTVQQVVKAGSLDDLGANGMVTVWGDKQGDRFIARVIVFR